MSGLVAGAKKVPRKIFGREAASLDVRVAGLGQAVEGGRGRLDDTVVAAAATVVERAEARLRLSADHTVVALAGATGSGKSSTFNALCGLDLAAVGVRRPTTSWATACIWGADPADGLLEWLDIPERHRVLRDSRLDSGQQEKELTGLVLLDLPDHDSTEVSHHLEVDRLIGMTDLMIWVLDPQKYADAAVHDRFLRPMATHKDVMLVVVNHIDEVPEDRRPSLLDDVRRLLEVDGLGGVPVLAISATTGEGIDALRTAVGKRVSDKASVRTRLTGDVSAAATRMARAQRGRGATRSRFEGPGRSGRGTDRGSRGPDRHRRRPPGHHHPGATSHWVAADRVGLPAPAGPPAAAAPRPRHLRQGPDRRCSVLDADHQRRPPGEGGDHGP